MRRGIVVILALAVVLVFVLGAVALAAPSGGANNNPLGIERSTYVERMAGTPYAGIPFGQLQSAWVDAVRNGTNLFLDGVDQGFGPGDFANYGAYLADWKNATFKQ